MLFFIHCESEYSEQIFSLPPGHCKLRRKTFSLFKSVETNLPQYPKLPQGHLVQHASKQCVTADPGLIPSKEFKRVCFITDTTLTSGGGGGGGSLSSSGGDGGGRVGSLSWRGGGGGRVGCPSSIGVKQHLQTPLRSYSSRATSRSAA